MGCGGRRTLLATEVIFSVLICLCVMSGYQTLPVAGSQSCLQNPLLAKSRGLCASFSALCGFEVPARLNLSLIMTAEVRDDLADPTSRLLACLFLSSISQCTCRFYIQTCQDSSSWESAPTDSEIGSLRLK